MEKKTIKLFVVESPGKIKIISQILGREYVVHATCGHCYQIAPHLNSIDTENNFATTYEPISGKEKIIREIKELSKGASIVLLSSDNDREGESISAQIVKMIGKDVPYKRIKFNEITEKAIKYAIEHPVDLDQNLLDAQQARAVLDMLVGFLVTRKLWSNVGSNLSAGRVQSIGLRLIVDRQKEINVFKPEEYWSIEAKAKTQENKEFAVAYKIEEKIKCKEEADKILEQINSVKQWTVKSADCVQKIRKPAPLFQTSTLQQFCSSTFDWDAKKTMIVAQQLYEAGLITYHRTDSVNISDTAIQEVRDLITKIGSEYLPSKPIIYKSRENAQEAHEGIRPSHLEHTLDDVKNQVNAEQFKLYDVIFRRFVSCQMTDAKFNATKIVIESDDKKHNFIANGNILSFDGFLLVWTYTDSKDLILPTVSKNGKLSLIDVNGIQHFTKPPAQYNDASLIKYLEEKGVGRPSTYASIIDTLKKRGYVEKKGKALVPTEIAFKVSDFLVANFPELMNIDYTARVESDLDEIANAKKVWHEAVGEFYCELKKRLDAVKASDRPASFAEVTKIVCPQCQRNMLVKRKGKFGEFYGCSGYKASRDGKKDKNFCDATFKIGENGDPVRGQTKPVEVFDKRKCDCGAKLLIRTAKKTGDKFVGCSRFPMCRNVYSIQGVKIERDN